MQLTEMYHSVLDSWISDGKLAHPLMSGKPSCIECMAALRDICAEPSETTTEATEQVHDFIGEAEHYVLILIDGLGDRFQNRFPANGFFENADRMPLTSGFPSATAAMLTSFMTATWPGEHGICGWNTYFKEFSRTISILPFREFGTGISGSSLGIEIDKLIPVKSWLKNSTFDVLSILPGKVPVSEYSKWSRGGTAAVSYNSLSKASRHIHRHIRSKPRTLTYCYIPDVDAAAHKYGCESPELGSIIYGIDQWMSQLQKKLPTGSKLLGLADHGMIDTVKKHYYIMNENDPLLHYLSGPPSGEPAAPHFHVIPGQEDSFLEAFRQSDYSRNFILCEKQYAERLHLFGPEPLSPVMRQHCGDFIGIAAVPAVLEFLQDGMKPINYQAIHGGLRPEELAVTLYSR